MGRWILSPSSPSSPLPPLSYSPTPPLKLMPLPPLNRNIPASSTRVILVRHGQSTSNAEKRHQGSSDESVLTTHGRITAYQTGLRLRNLNIGAVYVSPLQRTQETAQEIMAAIATETEQLPTVITHPALKEISLSQWEGLPYQVVREQFAEEYRCWKDQPDQFQMRFDTEDSLPQNGALTLASSTQCRFPVLELYDRAQQFWQEILPLHGGKTLVIVSHAGTNRALLNTALSMAPNRFHALQQSNCGVSILYFPNNLQQPTCLELMNSTQHLGEVLPKLKEGKQGLRLLIVPIDQADPNSIQVLADRLKTIEIDFSISNDRAQPTVEQLLQTHPGAVQLQVMRADFPQAWQQMLMSRGSQSRSPAALENRPLTALVVVQPAIALELLSQLLEIHPQHLHLNPNSLSVVHYPQTSKKPVLQALNAA